MLWSSCLCLCRLVLCHLSLLLHLESGRFLFITGLSASAKLGPSGSKFFADISYACRWVGSFYLCTFITSKQEKGGHCSFWGIFVLLLSLLPLRLLGLLGLLGLLYLRLFGLLCCGLLCLLCGWLLFRRLLGCSLFGYLLCHLLNGGLFCLCSRLF